MPSPLLSICIPTYNFGEFIGVTLESIVTQLPKGVEITILDGGSTDGTKEVVREFQSYYPQIRYHKFEARGGIDRDMARCVELARGEFCWLFSADDVMKPGAIQRVLQAIASSCDVYICKHSLCDIDMNVFGETGVLDVLKEETFDLSDAAQRLRYFKLAQSSEAFFSFMGGLIINREKWNSVPLNEAFIGSCWAHVARMFELIGTGLSVTYIPETLLHRRGDNDSFADRGVVNRFRIAIEGYHRLAEAFFLHESKEAFHIRRVIRGEFKFRTFLAAAMLCRNNPASESLVLLNRLIINAYCDRPFTARLISAGCIAFPARLYPQMRAAFKRLMRPLRTLRGIRS
jgi:abequosyltransferase